MSLTLRKKYLFLWVAPLCTLIVAVMAFAVGRQMLSASRTNRAAVTLQGVNDHRPAPPTNLRVSVDGVPQPEPFDITVVVPETIRIDQTGEITFKLLHPTAVTTSAGLNVPLVDSPAFDIKGPNSYSDDPNAIQWHWLLTPKRIGSQKISLQIPDNYPNLKDLGAKEAADESGSGTQREYIFDIQVVNELGLTSRESYILGSGAAVVSLLATIFGFPLIKRYFEPSEKAEERAHGSSQS